MTQELATQEPEEIQMAEEADAQAAQRTEDEQTKRSKRNASDSCS